MKKVLAALGAVCAATAVGGASVLAKTIVLGGYPSTLLLVDETTGELTERVPLATGLPTNVQISADKKFVYITTNTNSGIEVFDAETRKIVKSFSLNTPTTKYRFWGGAVDPAGRYYYTTGHRIDKQIDRYKVGDPRYLVIDLEKEEVVRSEEIEYKDRRSTRRLAVSADGKTLYMFGEKVIAVNTETLKVDKRIDLTEPAPPGVGEIGLGGSIDRLSSATEYVSLFNATDPYIHNEVFGIARFDLASQDVDFTSIGQAPDRMSNLEITPDGKTGYAVVSHGNYGNKRCEFWRFNLDANEITGKSEFECRSRFTFGMSSSGEKLYVYAAGYEIEVFDAMTFEREKVWNLNNDITGGGMVFID